MAPRDDTDWLTLGQAARFLGVAQGTMRKWADEARVPAFYTPGGHRRFRRADLEAFLGRSGPRRRAAPSRRVLLVIDEAGLRALLREALERDGYSVADADGAEAAVTALGEAVPDLVLARAADALDASELELRIEERCGPGVVPVLSFISPQWHDADVEHLLAQAKQLLGTS
jgi:excisionase family DNA binding protein